MLFRNDSQVKTLCLLGNVACFLSSADFFFFSKLAFSKYYLKNTIRVSNISSPDQVGHFVGPGPGLNFCKGYQQTTQVGKKVYQYT